MALNSHSGIKRFHASHGESTTSLHATISETISSYIRTASETASAWSSKLPEIFRRIRQDTKGKGSEHPNSQSVAVTEEYHSDYVNEQRKAIIEELGATVSWGTSEYRTSIVPPLRPEFDIDRISDYLITKKHLKRKGDSYIWREFETKSNATESTIYDKPLENVFNAIIDAALKTNGIKETQALLLLTDGNYAPWSVRRSGIRPGGFIVLQDGDEAKENSTLWYNIAACFTFITNRCSNDIFENIIQAIHSMQHVLAIDPCRRFTYGFTVERTRIKLWIATRAMVISCESFDFQTQYKELIRLFLSLSFASKEELGWDMTVKPEPEGNSRNYDFEIAGEHYLTSEKDMIIGDKATDIVGSGTRIWHAWKGSKESGDEVIIKDYWPSEDRETEDVLHRMILDDIKDVEKRQFFIEHTLNKIAAENVRACGKEDHTEKTILRGKSPDLSTLYELPQPPSKFSFKDKTTNIIGMEASLKTGVRRLESELRANERTKYYHRKHRRIVYKEVAIPFYELRNTRDMYIVIVDALKTLLILHEAGWVHRDISAGNLYLYEDPVSKVKRGLIGDFEYVKKVGWEGKHNNRTGTPNFMAVEITRQNYLCGIGKGVPLEDIQSSDEENEPTKESLKGTDDIEDGIFYNYIHDLESLWWILVWVSFAYVESPAPTDEDSLNRALTQRMQYHKLFPGDMSVSERERFLTRTKTFTGFIKLIPRTFNKQVRFVKIFRKLLVQMYRDVEYNLSESGPIHLPDTNRLHDLLLSRIPNYEFEEIVVTPVLDRRKCDYDEDGLKGSKRRADDDSRSGSKLKRNRLH